MKQSPHRETTHYHAFASFYFHLPLLRRGFHLKQICQSYKFKNFESFVTRGSKKKKKKNRLNEISLPLKIITCSHFIYEVLFIRVCLTHNHERHVTEISFN